MNIQNYFSSNEFFGYFFRKEDAQRPTNFSLKSMHFINKLSILMFLVGVLVLLYRLFIR